MSRPGPPAGRTAGNSPIAANGRGILLLLVAFIIGVAILRSTDPGGGRSSGAPAGSATTTTKAGRSTTTSAPATTTLPARPAAEVKVLPVNSSGIAGAGGKTGDQLRAAGYANTLAAVNSTSSTPVSTSTVEFAAGAEADAQAIAKLLNLPTTVVKPLASPPVQDRRGAEVVILIGGDLATAINASSATSTTGG